MTAKNAEGYPDPTAEEAIRHVMRGGKLDYTSFRTYEELQDYLRSIDSIYRRKQR